MTTPEEHYEYAENLLAVEDSQKDHDDSPNQFRTLLQAIAHALLSTPSTST